MIVIRAGEVEVIAIEEREVEKRELLSLYTQSGNIVVNGVHTSG